MIVVPTSKCTACGYVCDAATCPSNDTATPRPGDITVCIDCGHLMAFDDQLYLRDLTEDEMCEIAGDKMLLVMQKVRTVFNQ